jgi:hypothetical protein
MNIIYLAGNSLNNKTWIEKVKSEFDIFSTGIILNYDHWTNGNKFIDFEAESKNLAELVKTQDNYYIFAKSVGSILALKTIYEKTINPQKIILCGHPYLLAQEVGLPIDDYLKTLSVPTTFIQNEFDPLYSFSKLEETLKELAPANYQLIKNSNNDTHDYEDYPSLANIVKEFFR